MKQPTKRIASLQLRTRYSVMRVTLVRTTKKIKRRRRKKNGVAVGAGAEARVVVEAKAEAEVGAEVGVEVEATAAADPKAVERVQAIKPLSRT